jgi:hypothetical protein
MVWAALTVRKVLIVISAVFAPLAFAGSLADITASWVRRWIEVTVALIVSKLVLVIIFVVGLDMLVKGVGQAGTGHAQEVTQAVSGLLVLAVAGFAPWLALRLVHWSGDQFHQIHGLATTSAAGAQKAVQAPQKAMPWVTGGGAGGAGVLAATGAAKDAGANGAGRLAATGGAGGVGPNGTGGAAPGGRAGSAAALTTPSTRPAGAAPAPAESGPARGSNGATVASGGETAGPMTAGNDGRPAPALPAVNGSHNSDLTGWAGAPAGPGSSVDSVTHSSALDSRSSRSMSALHPEGGAPGGAVSRSLSQEARPAPAPPWQSANRPGDDTRERD